MTETERILAAMPTLGEFTVADLVRACDARAATVRTVLQRNEDRFEQVGVEETKRPGGKWKRYRSRAATSEAMAQDAAGGSSPAGVPAELIAAEELLLEPSATAADVETRASFLRRARRFREDASESGPSEENSAFSAHLMAVDLLMKLTEGEVADDPAALLEVRLGVRARQKLLSDGGSELVEALERRLEMSPLAARSASDTTSSDVLAEVLGLVSSYSKRTIPLQGVPRTWPIPQPMGRLAVANARKPAFDIAQSRSLDLTAATKSGLDFVEHRWVSEAMPYEHVVIGYHNQRPNWGVKSAVPIAR
jgi:hypothetical protein